MRKTLQTAALIASVALPLQSLAGEPFGRLFFTPAQRSALDAGKQIRTQKASPAPEARSPREITLSGVVTRSDGDSTVWINGIALDKRSSGVSARTTGSDPAAAEVRLAGARNSVRMRVGQHLESSSGRIAERYSQTAQAGKKVDPNLTAKEANAEGKPPPATADAVRASAPEN